jgi:hypothetical protein
VLLAVANRSLDIEDTGSQTRDDKDQLMQDVKQIEVVLAQALEHYLFDSPVCEPQRFLDE